MVSLTYFYSGDNCHKTHWNVFTKWWKVQWWIFKYNPVHLSIGFQRWPDMTLKSSSCRVSHDSNRFINWEHEGRNAANWTAGDTSAPCSGPGGGKYELTHGCSRTRHQPATCDATPSPNRWSVLLFIKASSCWLKVISSWDGFDLFEL